MANARKQKSGNWRVLVYTGKDGAGKRVYKSFTGSTKKEAERKAAEFREEKKQPLTLGEYAARYLEEKCNVLSPSTLRGYDSIVRGGIIGLSGFPISGIDSSAVQRSVNEYARDHSAKTVRNVYGFITVILQTYAPDIHLRVTLPQREKKEIFIPDPALIQYLYNKVKNGRMEYAFLLASQCGLRASEIAGLEKEKIFPDRIVIREALVRGRDSFVRKKTKTEAGTRIVPISPSLSARLLYLFDRPRYAPSCVSAEWNKFIRRENPSDPFSFHKLRHYFASNALIHDVPPRYISQLMGHSSEDMINKIYMHVFADKQKEYASRLFGQTDELLGDENKAQK